jgi:hypothetical protein
MAEEMAVCALQGQHVMFHGVYEVGACMEMKPYSEEEESHNQALHVRRGSRISHLVGRDVCETFSHGGEDVQRDLGPELRVLLVFHQDFDSRARVENAYREWRDTAADRTVGSIVAARTCLVDTPLKNSSNDGGEGCKCETDSDTGNATKMDLVLAEEGV